MQKHWGGTYFPLPKRMEFRASRFWKFGGIKGRPGAWGLRDVESGGLVSLMFRDVGV